MSIAIAAASGLAGATVLTLIHQTAIQLTPDAPRMDILGMRAIDAALNAADQPTPAKDDLFAATLAGDIVTNSAYYSLVGLAGPEKAVLAGVLLGLAAGVGGVVLPGPLGLGEAPSARTARTKAMTVAWYTAGGVAAGLAYRWLSKR
jgi:hypothetical protein